MRDIDHVRRFAMPVACLTAMIQLAGCSTPSWLCWFPGGVKTMTLVTAPDTNGDRTIAVDLVFITQDLSPHHLRLGCQRFYGISLNDLALYQL